jgi:hypothetical protein
MASPNDFWKNKQLERFFEVASLLLNGKYRFISRPGSG